MHYTGFVSLRCKNSASLIFSRPDTGGASSVSQTMAMDLDRLGPSFSSRLLVVRTAGVVGSLQSWIC